MGVGVRADNLADAPVGAVASLRTWTTEEFSAALQPWNMLLARAHANSLFMSWEWQWNWWYFHQSIVNGELLILAGYDAEGELVGLAPLYLYKATHRGVPATRLELLGSSWRVDTSVFSEYLDFIVDPRYSVSFLATVARALHEDVRWSDLVVSNTRVDGLAAQMVRGYFPSSYLRAVDPLVAYTAHLPPDFGEYVRSLDRSTRRRVWNQRKKLNQADFILFEGGRVGAVLDQLDRYHLHRWGQAHYVGVRRAFHERFASEMSRRHVLKMSELRRDGQPISIMYNVRVGDTEYNVQSGFDASVSRGISPGYLHFGYCIERACEEGVRDFDFLGGPGLHREYKRDFCTEKTRMITLQSIRARTLAWLYREYDRHYAPVASVTPT